jgi:hypothetical protein
MKREKINKRLVYLPCSVGVSSVSRDRKRASRSFRRDRLLQKKQRKYLLIVIYSEIEFFTYRRETIVPDEVGVTDSGSVGDSLVVFCSDADDE